MRLFGCHVTILNTIDHLGNQSNGSAGTKSYDNVDKTRVEIVLDKHYILLPLWTQYPPFSSSSKDSPGVGFKPSGGRKRRMLKIQGMKIVSLTDNAASIEDNDVDENIIYVCVDDLNIPDLEEISRFGDVGDHDSGDDINNLDTYFQNALQTFLPQIRAEIREEFHTSSGPLNSGGNPPSVTIHTWLERFNKQKPRSFEKATAPFFPRPEQEPAGTAEEQAKNFRWGLRMSTLNHLMCILFTDVAQVANVARNYEILHEKDDDDAERPEKR
nr:zinc finger, CCHC-type, retrotransposon Gag domain protein [Tanacetum cinerariifolium]